LSAGPRPGRHRAEVRVDRLVRLSGPRASGAASVAGVWDRGPTCRDRSRMWIGVGESRRVSLAWNVRKCPPPQIDGQAFDYSLPRGGKIEVLKGSDSFFSLLFFFSFSIVLITLLDTGSRKRCENPAVRAGNVPRPPALEPLKASARYGHVRAAPIRFTR